MTALGKALFSLLLVGAGFLLASVFGPPDLADNLADRMTLGRPVDPWGDLRPAEASAAPDTWATFAPRFDPQTPADAGLQRVDQAPSFAPTPYAAAPTTPAPAAWSPQPLTLQPPTLEVAPPAAGFAQANALQDTAVQPAAADERQLVGDRYASQAAWPPAQQAAAPNRSMQPATTAPAMVSAANLASSEPPRMTTPGAAQQPNDWPTDGYRSASYRRAAPAADAWSRALPSEQPLAASPVATPPIAASPFAAAPIAGAQPLASAPMQPAVAPPMAETPPFATPSALGWPAPVATIGLPQADAGDAALSQRAAMAPSSDQSEFASEPRIHIVADGDTLAGIAQRYLGDPSRAADVFAWNRSVLGNPQLLPIGVELSVDGPADSAPHGRVGVDNTPGMTPVGAAGPNPTAPRARLLAPQSAGFAQSAGYTPIPNGPRYGGR